jgi:hypothetical protein
MKIYEERWKIKIYFTNGEHAGIHEMKWCTEEHGIWTGEIKEKPEPNGKVEEEATKMNNPIINLIWS